MRKETSAICVMCKSGFVFTDAPYGFANANICLSYFFVAFLDFFLVCYCVDCGIQSILGATPSMSLSKMAALGDWPWHVSLHRDETHVCDGTLVSENWVLTTDSCFQGQPKATWIAVFGNIRLNTKTPWTQRRRIVSTFLLEMRAK